MWKPRARELVAWKTAWSIILRVCADGWSTTYKAKDCTNFGFFVEPTCATWTAERRKA